MYKSLSCGMSSRAVWLRAVQQHSFSAAVLICRAQTAGFPRKNKRLKRRNIHFALRRASLPKKTTKNLEIVSMFREEERRKA